MNWAALRLLFVHEMRMVLRSRRTIVTSLVLPAVLMPMMILGARYVQRAAGDPTRPDNFSICDHRAVGGPGSAADRSLQDRRRVQEFPIEEVNPTDPDQALDDRTLHFYIRTMTVEEADKAAAAATDEDVEPPGLNTRPCARIPACPAFRLFTGEASRSRALGAERMVDMMRAARRNESYSIMLSRGFPSHPEGILALTATNVATESQISGSNLGRFFTVVLVVWLVAAGSIVAMDIIAGEKERGTLETLITTGAGRAEIATAKHLAIWTVGLVITFTQIVYALIYIRLRVIQLPPNFAIDLSAQSIAATFHSVRSLGGGYSGSLADRFGPCKDL